MHLLSVILAEVGIDVRVETTHRRRDARLGKMAHNSDVHSDLVVPCGNALDADNLLVKEAR